MTEIWLNPISGKKTRKENTKHIQLDLTKKAKMFFDLYADFATVNTESMYQFIAKNEDAYSFVAMLISLNYIMQYSGKQEFSKNLKNIGLSQKRYEKYYHVFSKNCQNMYKMLKTLHQLAKQYGFEIEQISTVTAKEAYHSIDISRPYNSDEYYLNVSCKLPFGGTFMLKNIYAADGKMFLENSESQWRMAIIRGLILIKPQVDYRNSSKANVDKIMFHNMFNGVENEFDRDQNATQQFNNCLNDLGIIYEKPSN